MGLLFRFIIFVFAAGPLYSLPAIECCADDGERKEAGLRVATFQCDITPPVNEPIGLGFIALPKTVEHPLLAKGLVLQDAGIFQVYFTGCGGDVAMGKYNDRSREARTVLTNRIHEAMQRSVADVTLQAVTPIRWHTSAVQFPPRRDPAFMEEANRALLADTGATFIVRLKAAFNLAWIERTEARRAVEVSCLTMGSVQLLHLPGEPFVQYQLAAQSLRPESFVIVAGYGDCGMSYIGGNRIYTDRGGYEQTYAFSGPCEQLLLTTMEHLLEGM